MNGNKLLLDSNIVIYLSKQMLSVSAFANPDDMLYISLVTYLEVAGYKFTNVPEESFTQTLLASLQHLPITKSIADRVVTYRKLRKIKLPDAIILAAASEYKCQLITRNVSDFEGVDNQVIITDPFAT